MNVTGRILFFVGKMVAAVDKTLVAPMVDPAIRKSGDAMFAKDVSAALGTLLETRQATLIENDEADNTRQRLFDEAIVTIRSSRLRLRFIRVRGQLGLCLSSSDRQMEWTDVDRLVLSPENQAHEEAQHNWNDQDLPEIRDFLQRHWPRLEDLASRKALK